ncbi:MAG: TonB-dependent receptor [Gemmatimonadetes bacterium]|nr:TonB-dependent receptor [Gemmatimonadota bacterium]
MTFRILASCRDRGFAGSVIGVLLASSTASGLFAQDPGRISGRVIADESAKPLGLAQVTVAGLDIGTTTDVDGRFTIRGVPAGTHGLRVQLIGYATKTISGVVVTGGDVVVVDVSLPTQAVQLQELTVAVADERGTTSALLENRQAAAAVTDAIGREQISESPDSDAAAAMARVPGVSIVDKKFVYVRGLGERYGATTLDGAVMPSPIADRKAVPLDLVPASFIENVSTSKSYLPNQPADYAGGLVQIETRRVPGEKFFKIGVGGSWDTQTTGKTGLDYSGGDLDFLGIDDGIRDLPSLLPTDRAVNPSNLSPAELEAIGEAFAPQWAGLPSDHPIARSGELAFATEIPIGSRDLGILATAHWDDSWNRRNNYVERVFAASGISDPEVDYTGQVSSHNVTLGGLLNADIALAPAHRISFNGVLNRVTEDQSRILEGFNLDSNADQRNTRIQYVENSLMQGRLSGKHFFDVLGGTTVEWKGAYSRASRYEPNTREVLYRENNGVFLWDNFIQSGSIFHQDLEEDALNGNLDIQLPIRMNDTPGTIEIGAAVIRRDRDVLTRRFRFIPQGVISAETRALAPDQIFSPENIGPDAFQIQEATFRPDNYDADLTTLGAYVMADFELLPRLRFAGGGRVERTEQNVNPRDLFATTLDPLPGAALDDTDFVPGATLTWATTDEINIRVAASRTLARPEFRELAPFSFADFAGGYLVIGNPVLERSRITNFDLRWEWFPSPGAVVAVSGFYKRFADPIEEVVFPSSEFIKSWVNAPSAENLGTEIEARSSLGFLSQGLESFSANLNLTLVDSEVETGTTAQIFVPGTGSLDIEIVDRQRRLQGQSGFVFNAGANWRSSGGNTTLNLLYNRFGRRISQVGTQFLEDVFEEPRDQLDFVFEQKLNEQISVKGSATNILASDYRFTQAGDLLRGWEPGRAFSMKVSWQPVGSS